MRQRFYGILIAGLGLLVMSRPYTAQADAGDPNLQGDWRIVSVFCDGSLSPLSEGYVRVLIYDNKIVFARLNNAGTPRTFCTDPSRTPKTLDVHWDIFLHGHEVVDTGIYELEQRRLRICQGPDRPTEFATKPNDRRTLLVLERDDADGPMPSVSAIAASREAIIRKIAANLPKGWAYETGPTSVALRRTEEPVIVNLMQLGDEPNKGETRED